MAQSGEASAGDLDGEIIVRRARPSDYEAIVNMMEVYAGLDYMPTLFHTFMHSKQHTVLVVERIKDRKLLSLANFRVSADCRTVYPMSGRVLPEYRGHGLTQLMRNKFIEDHPDVERSMLDGVLQSGAERFLMTNDIGTFSRQYYWTTSWYCINNASLQSWSTKSQTASPGDSEEIVEIRAADVDDNLEHVRKFLRRYAECLPGAHPTWRATSLDEDVDGWLREQLLSTRVLTTKAGRGTGPSTVSIHRDLRNQSPLVAVSFLYPFLLKTLQYDGHVRGHLFVYCDDVKALSDHVAAQLRHLANIVENNGRDVFVTINFPSTIDVESAGKCFAAGDDRWPKGMDKSMKNTSNYLARLELPKSML